MESVDSLYEAKFVLFKIHYLMRNELHDNLICADYLKLKNEM